MIKAGEFGKTIFDFTLTFIGLTYILTSIITAYYQIFLARSISSLYNLRED